MSKKSFEAFVARVGEDVALREELEGLAKSDDGVPVEAVAEFARSKGYEFSVEDATASASSELSDEDLDRVSGGFGSLSTSFLKFDHKLYPSFDTGGSLYFKLG